jgi:hypothetical protein
MYTVQRGRENVLTSCLCRISISSPFRMAARWESQEYVRWVKAKQLFINTAYQRQKRAALLVAKARGYNPQRTAVYVAACTGETIIRPWSQCCICRARFEHKMYDGRLRFCMAPSCSSMVCNRSPECGRTTIWGDRYCKPCVDKGLCPSFREQVTNYATFWSVEHIEKVIAETEAHMKEQAKTTHSHITNS